MPIVLNARKSGIGVANAVYVGRPSKFGNPFPLKNEKERLAVLAKYEEWILSQPDFCAIIKQELKGKHLICWCAPKPCHADILLRIANEYICIK